MTDLAVREQPTTITTSAPAQLVEWAAAARAAHSLAVPLCKTEFVPAHFRGNEAAATAAILFGAELGLSPLQALQGLYVIGGKPAMYARTLLAVTLAHGHEVWVKEQTDTRVIVEGKRRGTDNVERVVWTIDRAKKAGYTKNPKYTTDPQGMLLARAQSDMCRRLAADALLGMAYSAEELEDETATVEPQRKARRKADPAPVPEPDAETPRSDGEPVAAAPEPEWPDVQQAQ